MHGQMINHILAAIEKSRCIALVHQWIITIDRMTEDRLDKTDLVVNRGLVQIDGNSTINVAEQALPVFAIGKSYETNRF